MWALKETRQHGMMAFAILTGGLVISLRKNRSDTFIDKNIG